MYKEDFAVADVATLGSTMTLLSGTNQRIVSGAALGNATGSTGGWYRYNVGKIASDHMRVDARLITPPTGTLNSGVGVFVLARLPDTFATAGAPGTYAAASLATSGAWTIQSVNQTSFTSRASGTMTAPTLPGTFTLIAAGATYVALWNNQQISGATWTDTSNTVISIGATKRNWGLIVQCSATNQQHPGIDWAAAHDLSGRFFSAS